MLPAGEYATANGNLAALGTSGEWKLVQNNDIKIAKTNVAVKDNGGYTITADTDIAAVDSDDYISLIIKKSDGSISHYGRYAMAAPETTFDIIH